MTVVYIIVAILIFGILIAVHELGHFTAAKLLGVRVNEFSIGMGPALFKRQRGETLYAWRALPVGGFCAMEGEDELSDDARAFSSAPFWKRLIILVAGSFTNFLLGFLVVLILFSLIAPAFYTTTIDRFAADSTLSLDTGLLPGDRLVEVDGEPIWLSSDVYTILSRTTAEQVAVTVERGGEKLALGSVPLTYADLNQFAFTVERSNVFVQLRNAWYNSLNFVRLVRMSLVDLVTGNVGVQDLSGPIGIVDTITDVGTDENSTPAEAAQNVAYLAAFIAVNLAVMNMLPIPALDGGRVFFLIVTTIIEKIRRKRIDPKYENYIHMAGLVFFLCLMVLVAFNDVARIVAR